MEGNPLERPVAGKAGHIPGIPENSYDIKIERLRALENSIKDDEELEQKIRVDKEKGMPLPIAEKMLKDTIARLAGNKKELARLMGGTVQ